MHTKHRLIATSFNHQIIACQMSLDISSMMLQNGQIHPEFHCRVMIYKCLRPSWQLDYRKAWKKHNAAIILPLFWQEHANISYELLCFMSTTAAASKSPFWPLPCLAFDLFAPAGPFKGFLSQHNSRLTRILMTCCLITFWGRYNDIPQTIQQLEAHTETVTCKVICILCIQRAMTVT